jgi:hypothetical protein
MTRTGAAINGRGSFGTRSREAGHSGTDAAASCGCVVRPVIAFIGQTRTRRSITT